MDREERVGLGADGTSDQGEARPAQPRRRLFFLVPQLFLFPLLLVGAMVLIYLFFAAAAEETRTIPQLIRAIRTERVLDRQTPSRAAEELAQHSREMERAGKKLDAKDTGDLLAAIRQFRGNPMIHKYLVLALGRVGGEDQALPYLQSVLADPESDEGSRVEAIFGLALSRSPAAVEQLTAALGRYRDADQGEVRAYILQALTNIAGPSIEMRPGLSPERRQEIAALLKRHVADPSPMVSRNVAMWLAENFEDPSGVAVLRPLLDWKYLEDQRLPPNEQELLMVRAIDCLAKLGDEDSLEAIRRHGGDNRSYKVKNAALHALNSGAWGAKGPSLDFSTPTAAEQIFPPASSSSERFDPRRMSNTPPVKPPLRPRIRRKSLAWWWLARDFPVSPAASLRLEQAILPRRTARGSRKIQARSGVGRGERESSGGDGLVARS